MSDTSDTPQFMEGVDVDNAKAVQKASDKAAAWADEQAAKNFDVLPPVLQKQAIAQRDASQNAVKPNGSLETQVVKRDVKT